MRGEGSLAVADDVSAGAEPGQAPAESGRRKPIIFAVDDDPGVLGAVARDLRREYGGEYRIMRADGGAKALGALEQARLANDDVALFLSDQRMPEMSGLEFLSRAKALFPNAKRVLLTAYADTDASIRAINETRLDYYLMKPWDPPEERLYPVLTDLLDDWRAAFLPSSLGVTVIGHTYSAAAHAVKEFLGRNVVPFRWLDVETAPEARDLLELAGAGPTDLPVVLLEDGKALLKPTTPDIARHIGLRTAPALEFYDLVVVGAGPAGLGAGVYGASEGLSTLLIESHSPGGQAGTSSRIENYLGFPSGLSGADLSRRATTQAKRLGAEILTPTEAVGLELRGALRVVRLADGREVAARALLVATGVSYRMLDVPGAERLAGSGLYYGAALTEALAVRGGHALIVGGGNSAGQAAMYLARFAERVTVLVRGPGLAATMSRYLIAQIEETPNIAVQYRREVTAVHGESRLEGVTVALRDTGEAEVVPAEALFVFIGAAPRTDWLAGSVAVDELGFVPTGPALAANGAPPARWPLRRPPYWLEASVPGVFAAGDVRQRSVKRVASAVGEGAMALMFIHQYLAEG